jgi:hypothetical protein
VRYANQLPQQIEGLIVRLKGEKPHWGARKIRELLVRRLDGDVRVPAKSTIHAVLDRHGLVKRGGGPRHRARGTPLSQGAAPNDGPWRCRHCYGLTYRTCQEAPRDRYRSKAQRIRESLGGGPNLLDDFPPRPHGMRRTRYERLKAHHDEAANRATTLLASLVFGLNKRPGRSG